MAMLGPKDALEMKQSRQGAGLGGANVRLVGANLPGNAREPARFLRFGQYLRPFSRVHPAYTPNDGYGWVYTTTTFWYVGIPAWQGALRIHAAK
jgi:hypothetical protein